MGDTQAAFRGVIQAGSQFRPPPAACIFYLPGGWLGSPFVTRGVRGELRWSYFVFP